MKAPQPTPLPPTAFDQCLQGLPSGLFVELKGSLVSIEYPRKISNQGKLLLSSFTSVVPWFTNF